VVGRRSGSCLEVELKRLRIFLTTGLRAVQYTLREEWRSR